MWNFLIQVYLPFRVFIFGYDWGHDMDDLSGVILDEWQSSFAWRCFFRNKFNQLNSTTDRPKSLICTRILRWLVSDLSVADDGSICTESTNLTMMDDNKKKKPNSNWTIRHKLQTDSIERTTVELKHHSSFDEYKRWWIYFDQTDKQ